MSLYIDIFANETLLRGFSAKRIHPLKIGIGPDEICTYVLSNGKEIKHRYGDGAVVLAKKVLETAISEDKHGG